MFVLQSKNDNRIFRVNQNVIDASVLLKNSCELTQITEPIVLECSFWCLFTFIRLINHYDTITDVHDAEYEKELFERFDDEMLVQLVKEVAYLDSDFFVETFADIILVRIGGMSWDQMKTYFGFQDDPENDFTADERKQIDDRKFDFLISLKHEKLPLQFPLSPATNFYMLQHKFFTPFNIVLRRIIQRSNEKTSFNLSLINKSIKNEVDRYPIKISEFESTVAGNAFANHRWSFDKKGKPKFGWSIHCASYNENYITIIKSRKLFLYSQMVINLRPTASDYSVSFDSVIPKTPYLRVNFSYNEINKFDIQRCPFTSIFYKLDSTFVNFNEFYQTLIAKDLSKEIKINANGPTFGFFSDGVIHFFKKSSDEKFHEIYTTSRDKRFTSEFKNFLMRYMEEDGVIKSKYNMFKMQKSYCKTEKLYVFQYSEVKKLKKL